MDVEKLMRPFDESRIRQRVGPGRKALDYISGPDVIRRLLDATDNHFTWNVDRVQLVTQETPNGSVSIWVVQGTLTVGDLGFRSGVGTHLAESAEAAKAVETDALKRAAIKFGVGLHLYEEDGSHPIPPPQASNRNGNRNTDTANTTSYQRQAPSPERVGNGYRGPRPNSDAHPYRDGIEPV